MDVVIVLGKVPRAGDVKTRMIPFLNALESAELAAAFLVDLLATLREMTHCNIRWAIPPGAPPEEVARLTPPEVEVIDQGPGDLGERLARLAEGAFARGADAVTLVGSDHPNLPPALLRRCRTEAAAGRVGWIPTRDGGFAAMTLPRVLPQLFEGVPWSTPRVADAVRDNARRAGIVLAAVGSWYDVDTVQDLARLADDLATAGGCPATRRVLERLDPPLRERFDATLGEARDV